MKRTHSAEDWTHPQRKIIVNNAFRLGWWGGVGGKDRKLYLNNNKKKLEKKECIYFLFSWQWLRRSSELLADLRPTVLNSPKKGMNLPLTLGAERANAFPTVLPGRSLCLGCPAPAGLADSWQQQGHRLPRLPVPKMENDFLQKPLTWDLRASNVLVTCDKKPWVFKVPGRRLWKLMGNSA